MLLSIFAIPILLCLGEASGYSIHESHHRAHLRQSRGQLEDGGQNTRLLNETELSMFSVDCSNALSTALKCSPLVRNTVGYGIVEEPFSTRNLTDLCTQDCSLSLDNLRSAVIEKCGNETYTDPPSNAARYVPGTGVYDTIYNMEGISVKPVAFVDYYYLGYNLICMKDEKTPSNFCYEQIRKNDSSIDQCGPCILGALRAQIEDPRLYDESIVSEYSASASSCKSTYTPVPTPGAVWLSNQNTAVANYTATPSCTGSYAPIPTGAKCDDFALKNSVATNQLLMENGLVGGCVNWPGNLTKACIQKQCKVYVVQKNDTCLSVASSNGLTLSQLLSYNPSIDPVCDNFYTQIGHAICVGNQVGYIAPNVTLSASFTTSMGPSTTAAVPTNAIDSTERRCGKWYMIKAGDNCDSIRTGTGTSREVLLFLNPQLNTNCTNLLKDESYCIEPVGDISTYHGYGATLTLTFAPVNSSVLSQTRSSYSTPSISFPSASTTASYPLASGSVQSCYYMFDNDLGDITCWFAASMYSVSIAELIRWNPSLNESSCYLKNQHRYCGSFYNPSGVSSSLDLSTIPSVSATSTSLTSQSTTAQTSTIRTGTYTTPPAPTQSGIVNSCNSYAVAQKDDGCEAFADRYHISVDDFYSWNPALQGKCDKFFAEEAYCVGVE